LKEFGLLARPLRVNEDRRNGFPEEIKAQNLFGELLEINFFHNTWLTPKIQSVFLTNFYSF
jgi:hypothetical protein